MAAAPSLEERKTGAAAIRQCLLKTLALTADQAHMPLLEGVLFQVDVDVDCFLHENDNRLLLEMASTVTIGIDHFYEGKIASATKMKSNSYLWLQISVTWCSKLFDLCRKRFKNKYCTKNA